MLSQYICTFNRELSVDFYTRVMGLRWVGTHEPASGKGHARVEVLRILDETIQLASGSEARRIKRAASMRKPEIPAQDLYFLSRHSLDYARACIQAAGWGALEGPVTRQGNSHSLRMLYLLDPDGNRIRLIEVTG